MKQNKHQAQDWQLATTTTPEFQALVDSVDPPFKRVLRRAIPASMRYRIASLLLDAPITSVIVRRVDPKIRRIGRVDRSTEIVIEGFPRSANSYARVAFLLANPSVRVCSHTHSYRTVTRGVALGIPVIVLIRDPEPVIASSLQYGRGVPPIRVIKEYRKFYRHISRIPADRLVLANYEEVIRDFGSVIARCNALFESDFDLYPRTAKSEERIRNVLGVWEEEAIPDALRDTRSSLPRGARRDAAPRILSSLKPREQEALAIARAEYESLRNRFSPESAETTAGELSA